MSKSWITTHILNLHSGLPASGVEVALINPDNNIVAKTETDEDGRITDWLVAYEPQSGVWSLAFYVEKWFASQQQECFFSDIQLSFKTNTERAHYHVPLLLNQYGYSTYRGS